MSDTKYRQMLKKRREKAVYKSHFNIVFMSYLKLTIIGLSKEELFSVLEETEV
jgi:hypothetical protein